MSARSARGDDFLAVRNQKRTRAHKQCPRPLLRKRRKRHVDLGLGPGPHVRGFRSPPGRSAPLRQRGSRRSANSPQESRQRRQLRYATWSTVAPFASQAEAALSALWSTAGRVVGDIISLIDNATLALAGINDRKRAKAA